MSVLAVASGLRFAPSALKRSCVAILDMRPLKVARSPRDRRRLSLKVGPDSAPRNTESPRWRRRRPHLPSDTSRTGWADRTAGRRKSDERVHGPSTPGRERSDPAPARRSGRPAARAPGIDAGSHRRDAPLDRIHLRAVAPGAGPGALRSRLQHAAVSPPGRRGERMIGLMARRISSPIIVGRDDELALLRETIARGRGDEAETVVIAGEAGVGKSRLISQVVAEATDLSVRVVVGGCPALVDAP